MRRIGVLALQGAVSEHLAMLARSGASGTLVKKAEDLAGVEGLIIPGGESTAISRLIQHNGLADPIRSFAANRPVMGTCAGLILCASAVSGSGGAMPGEAEATSVDRAERLVPLGLIDITVSRNGFGRQVESFESPLAVLGIGEDIPGVFIRAPYIEHAGPGVRVLAEVKGRAVMAESGTVLVVAFHPELTADQRIVEYFLRKAG